MFFFAICSLTRFLTIFQTFSTFRPKSACSDVKNRYYSKISDRSRSNFHRSCAVDVREGMSFWNYSGSYTEVGVGGGEFFVPSPVIGGLTWSDSFALAERAALLPCKPRPLGLGDGWWGWDSFSVKANGRYSAYYISVNVGRYKGALLGRHR